MMQARLSKSPPTLNGVDLDLIANTNGVSNNETAETTKEPSATKEVKKVTIGEPTNENSNNNSTRTTETP